MISITPLASGSTGNCYCVSNVVTPPVLLEAGISFTRIQRGLKFGVSKLSGCLISHEHGDHSKAVKDLMAHGVDCYMSQETAISIGAPGHRLHIVYALEKFRICGWEVTPFDVEHDAAEPLGFLMEDGVERLLYVTDTAYCRYRFEGLTRIMIECNYSLDLLREGVKSGDIPLSHKNRVMCSHMSLDTLITTLKANDLSRVKGIHLLHLSDGNSDAEQFKRAIQEETGKPVYVC